MNSQDEQGNYGFRTMSTYSVNTLTCKYILITFEQMYVEINYCLCRPGFAGIFFL